jgi:hypothetical protein
MTQLAHHQFAPSSLDKLAVCPHYVGGKGGEYADAGTTVHELACGRVPVPDDLDMDTKEMLDFWFDVVGQEPVEQEVRLTLIDDAFDEILFGTADAVRVLDDRVQVFDLKTGDMHDYRLQMLAYAAAAMQTFSKDRAEVIIVYSRLKKNVTIDVRDFSEAVSEIQAVIAFAKNKDNCSRMPGDQCRWCADSVNCPALTQTATAIAVRYKPDMNLEDVHSSAICDPVEMSKVLRVAKVIIAWAESVQAHALNMALTGGILPGWRLMERRGNAKIIDPQKAFEASGLPVEKFLPLVSVSLTKLTEAYAAHFDVKKAQAKRLLEDQLAEIIVRGEGSKFLVQDKEQSNGLEQQSN